MLPTDIPSLMRDRHEWSNLNTDSHRGRLEGKRENFNHKAVTEVKQTQWSHHAPNKVVSLGGWLSQLLHLQELKPGKGCSFLGVFKHNAINCVYYGNNFAAHSPTGQCFFIIFLQACMW